MASTIELESMTEPIVKKIKKKKRSAHNFSIYLYKVLKSVDNMRISRKAMLIMNNFVNDMLEKIAMEASCLVSHSKKNTLTSRDIQSAINLVVPGELAKVANMQGIKAVAMYVNSRKPTKA